ncbi:hypothetical protein GSN00_11935 [Cylindrospermopsis raciborskii CHAB3438]|nr:hypothetical protein [Cylindrospermopsis raciborskii CHAB3438]MEB3144920.1 hypothetical protein [Cylindrospermopsis raciborskii]
MMTRECILVHSKIATRIWLLTLDEVKPKLQIHLDKHGGTVYYGWLCTNLGVYTKTTSSGISANRLSHSRSDQVDTKGW